MAWYVLYTKSRSEKVVTEKLRARGIDAYCPLIQKKRKWSDRIKLIDEPLFPSYCFVNLDEHQRAQVYGVPGVVRYLFWLNKPVIVKDSELDAIKQLLTDQEHSLIDVDGLQSADYARMGLGSFALLKGR